MAASQTSDGGGLAVREVTVRFGETTALDNVSLDVGSGRTMAVLGPSGCGKSTLLRVIAGLQPAQSGSVAFAGRSLEGLPPHRRGVGLMFQSHALFPHRNVGDNVGFGLKMANMAVSQRKERVAEMLAMVGLDGFEGRRIDTLSGGQAQRVALARSLAPGPALLLLDEPMGSLDRILRERLVADLHLLLTDLKQTALYVTHDYAEAEAVANDVAVMDAGRVLQAGSLDSVRANPGHPVVEQLLGLR